MRDSLQPSSAPPSEENGFDIDDMCAVSSELCEHFGIFTAEIYGVSILSNPESADIYDRVESLKQECKAAAEELTGAKLQKWVDSNIGKLNRLIEECAVFTGRYEYPFFADSLSAWMLRMHDEDRFEEAAAEHEEQITITAIEVLAALTNIDGLPRKDEIAAVLEELDFITSHLDKLEAIDDPDSVELITIETIQFLNDTINEIVRRYPDDLSALSNLCGIHSVTLVDCLNVMAMVKSGRLRGSLTDLAEKFCDVASNFLSEKRADCARRIRELRAKMMGAAA